MNSENILTQDWHPSKFVYHYTKRETLLEKVLVDRKFLFSPFESVDDPWESQSWNIVVKSSDDYPSPDETEEARKLINHAAKHNARILCLSCDRAAPKPRRDGCPPASPMGCDLHRGYARARMWSQYGDRHNGVCLVLYHDRLKAMIKSAIGKARTFSHRVQYTDYLDFSDALQFDYDNVRKAGLQRAIREHIGLYHRDLFFRKCRDWRDEAEFRCVILCDDDQPLYVPFGDAIAAVVLGAQFDRSYLPELHRLLDGNVAVLQVTWDNGTPRTQTVRVKRPGSE